MGEVVDLNKYKELKKRKRKQDLRERRENELEEAINSHPSKLRNKKFKDDE